MKRFYIVDIILRISAGLFVVGLQFAALFFSFLFSYSIHLTSSQYYALVFANIILFMWLIWPQKLESIIPGPNWLRHTIIRGPLYLIGVAGVALRVWLQVRRF